MAEYTRTPTEAPTAPLGMPPDIGVHGQAIILFFCYCFVNPRGVCDCFSFGLPPILARTSHVDIRQIEEV
jgi:hypothetical protein